MHHDLIDTLTRRLLAGELSREAFVAEIAGAGVAELAGATLDMDRRRRCGYPEVVFGEGKSVELLADIFTRLLAAGEPVFATRVAVEKAKLLAAKFSALRHNDIARTVRIDLEGVQPAKVGLAAVVTAGSSDLPVAEEAAETLDWMGVNVLRIADVGVAGPHRLPRHVERLRAADAIVVCAGMEGALPSVVGGYVACPVFAVPTSVGYGASFAGVAALLGMLNSCAANVAVVNIDAGFKAGYLAGLVARRMHSGEVSSP